MKPALFLLLSLCFTATGHTDEPVPEGNFPGEVRLLLPEAIPALSGLESNLYFQNILLTLNPANFLVDVTCAKGAQEVERWTWKPKEDESGDYPFMVEVRDVQNRIVARASTTLKLKSRTLPAIPEKPVTLLIIGDSLTAASIYPEQILDLASEDGLALTLIGTRGPGVEEGHLPVTPNRHEGYGGWTAERFVTHYTGIARGGPYKTCGSPFLYKNKPDDTAEKPGLDFSRYCQEFSGGRGPDFVTILLGCNDTFSATDETIEERIDTMFKHYETLVTMIHGLRPETRVGAILPMPPAATQDAFGSNYGSGQTRWQYRRNQQRVIERMLETFGGREKENLFLVPAYLNLDPVHGFPVVTGVVHSRSGTTVIRQSNGVHPSAEGYRQVGDAVYAWLRSFDGVIR